jgi:hypothetical protein
MLYVGIDQHRKQLTVHVRDDQGEVVLEEKTGATLCLALFEVVKCGFRRLVCLDCQTR